MRTRTDIRGTLRILLKRVFAVSLYAVAYVWRRILWRTTFIGITGSVGKTTAKECLAAILSSRFPTAKTRNNENETIGLPKTLFRVRPWHRFAVLEVAADGRGLMRRSARLVRPEVAVVLTVARTHTAQFKSLERTAADKARLPAALTPGGTAVLNQDDPRVADMTVPAGAQVVRFGSSASSEVSAELVSSNWPERLSLRVRAGNESCRVETRLVGTHWTPTVLGALAADAIGRVEPSPGRMQPATLPVGATMIRDEYNAGDWAGSRGKRRVSPT